MGFCGELRELRRGMGAARLWGSKSTGRRETRVGFHGREPPAPPRASQRREMSSAHGAAPYPGSVTRARTHAPRAAQSGAVPSGRAALGPPRNPRPQHSAAPRASGARGGGGGAVRSGAERGSGRRCGWGCAAAAAGAALTVRGTSRHRPAGMRLRPAWHGRTERGGSVGGCVLGTGGGISGDAGAASRVPGGCVPRSGGFQSRVPGVASPVARQMRSRAGGGSALWGHGGVCVLGKGRSARGGRTAEPQPGLSYRGCRQRSALPQQSAM